MRLRSAWSRAGRAGGLPPRLPRSGVLRIRRAFVPFSRGLGRIGESDATVQGVSSSSTDRVVLGAPTFGAGCGYADGGIATVLARSQGRVRMPDCVRYRSNGTNGVEGIEPDVPVYWRRNDTPAQRARRTIEAVWRVVTL